MGLTVKEKILVHLLQYNQYSAYDDVPEDVTQQGIASIIIAPRPHVSMSLKDLKDQNLITESTRHIREGRRKQKVYFLTTSGIQFTNNLNQRIKGTEISVKGPSGSSKQKLVDVMRNYKISIFEALANISDNGELDINKFKIDKTKEVKKPEFKNSSSTVLKTPSDFEFSYTTSAPNISEVKHKSNQLFNQDEFNYSYNQYGYDLDYYPTQEEPQYSERTSLALLITGYILFILGGICGIYLFTLYQSILIIPMILFFTFGTSIFIIGANSLWHIEKWQARISNISSISFPIIIYLIFYSAMSTELSIFDLSLWLLVIISFLALAFFGKFIPVNHRIQFLSALGAVMTINSPITFLFINIEIYQMGFWVLIGLVCGYVGYVMTSEHKNIESFYSGLLVGVGLGLIVGVILVSTYYDHSNLIGFENLYFAILLLWLVAGLIIIYNVYINYKQTERLIELIDSFKTAIPLYIGLLLLFFGLMLIILEKILECLIELFLSIIILYYGGLMIKSLKKRNLIVLVFISICFIITMAYLLFV